MAKSDKDWAKLFWPMFISVGITGLLTFLAFGSIISYVALVVRESTNKTLQMSM